LACTHTCSTTAVVGAAYPRSPSRDDERSRASVCSCEHPFTGQQARRFAWRSSWPHHQLVLFLGKTWHDADSVSFSRLQVVDWPRPHVRDDLSTKYGGIALVAVRLSHEARCQHPVRVVRAVVCARDFCIVVLRGLVVGDINIHLDRPDDSASRQFTDTLAAHGLACHATVTTVNAACLTSSLPVTTCRCCLLKSSTLVYRTTGCCGGPRRLQSRLRPIRRGQLGRGVSLTLTSSALHWCGPRCVILTHGLTVEAGINVHDVLPVTRRGRSGFRWWACWRAWTTPWGLLRSCLLWFVYPWGYTNDATSWPNLWSRSRSQ